jgi:hypothetical protein
VSLDWLKAVTTSVELGAVGYAAARTPAFLAYEALRTDREALRAHEDELVAIVGSNDSKPAAIIYAAYLLQAMGRTDLRELLARWDDDRRECTIWPGGCCGSTHWLCEATRFVMGETWSHPVRLLAISIEQIERANWLELPSDDTMRAIREGRRPDYRAHAIWVFRFAELHESAPAQLRLAREMLEAIRPLVARVYAALLIRQIDRVAGDVRLDKLETDEWIAIGKEKRTLRLREAVALARAWLSTSR